MATKKAAKSSSPEVKERGVRMVLEQQGEHAWQWAGVCGRELPIDPDGCGVAPVLPGLDVALQRRPVADPVRQVAAEGAQLDLGPIQPRAVPGRMVDFEPVGDALGRLGRERLVERGR